MRTAEAASVLALALVLGACHSPCADGFGRAADGNCYPVDADDTGDSGDTEIVTCPPALDPSGLPLGSSQLSLEIDLENSEPRSVQAVSGVPSFMGGHPLTELCTLDGVYSGDYAYDVSVTVLCGYPVIPGQYWVTAITVEWPETPIRASWFGVDVAAEDVPLVVLTGADSNVGIASGCLDKPATLHTLDEATLDHSAETVVVSNLVFNSIPWQPTAE